MTKTTTGQALAAKVDSRLREDGIPYRAVDLVDRIRDGLLDAEGGRVCIKIPSGSEFMLTEAEARAVIRIAR